jgi:hypothetical protein
MSQDKKMEEETVPQDSRTLLVVRVPCSALLLSHLTTKARQWGWWPWVANLHSQPFLSYFMTDSNPTLLPPPSPSLIILNQSVHEDKTMII